MNYQNDISATAYEIARACATKGGATICPKTQKDVRRGFAVGMGGAESLPATAARELNDEFMQAVHDASATAARTRGALGAWIHNGRVYVEPVDVMQDKGRAMEAARMRGEIAIFDLNTGTEILVK